MNIHQKLRLSNIPRWTMVNTTRQQSVAEHSYNVTLIAMELAKRMSVGEDYGGIDRFAIHKDIVLIAINHDLMEVLTGDIPAPTKMACD